MGGMFSQFFQSLKRQRTMDPLHVTMTGVRMGERFVQEDLARSLRYMADEERRVAATKGRAAGLRAARDAFYAGDIARTIVRFRWSRLLRSHWAARIFSRR